MKKILVKVWFISFVIFGLTFVQTASSAYAKFHNEHFDGHSHHHHIISDAELVRLLDQGYSKGEILKAAHIAKFANKKVDDVLKVYKENDSSWEKTAKHYGLDLEMLKKKHHEHKEKFLQEHKEVVIANVAKYLGKKKEDIQALADEGIPLRFIIAGAAMSKISNKDLAELIKLKKEGKSFKEIKEILNIDRHQMYTEMKTLMMKIKEDIKK
ncbi:hypothetical protein F7731_05580 [Cytobacillus depressus]|uniref:Uncharacterized protein n=1 Tax=Cytobacillus depressus TaxID=1602942 RepID=A0A6L3V6L9_9BACI|nr:hypothetical protein [Cytobacillus depressus]KAB2337097.1 hypothetical protein F7731_05580 [Cytobacillus depressus]